jgi:periplasmic protein TonB
MNFSQRQSDPRQHVLGFAIVVLFHVFIVYALVTGLAKKVVDVVRAPIETKVIEEIKRPPPPPEIVVPPPPKLEAPPPPFIPPPEVQIAAPPPPQPTITAVTPTPPPAPVVIAPAPTPPPAAPVAAAPPPPAPPAPPPPKPAVESVAGLCTNVQPPEAPSIEPVTGLIVVSYTIDGGKVTKVDLVKQTYTSQIGARTKRLLLASIEAAAKQYTCTGDHVGITQDFPIKIN